MTSDKCHSFPIHHNSKAEDSSQEEEEHSPVSCRAMSSSSMALFSPPSHFSTLSPSSTHRTHFSFTAFPSLRTRNPTFTTIRAAADNGAGISAAVAVETAVQPKDPEPEEQESLAAGANGSVAAAEEVEVVSKFEDPKWVNGTWDLTQFRKDGSTDWDAVIDAGKNPKFTW